MIECMASLTIWLRLDALVVRAQISRNLSLMHMRDFTRVKLLRSQRSGFSTPS